MVARGVVRHAGAEVILFLGVVLGDEEPEREQDAVVRHRECRVVCDPLDRWRGIFVVLVPEEVVKRSGAIHS